MLLLPPPRQRLLLLRLNTSTFAQTSKKSILTLRKEGNEEFVQHAERRTARLQTVGLLQR
jgi:hypothetical protein